MIKNILEYLESAACTYPNKVAFADNDVSLTFSQVLEYAKRVARLIQAECRGARNRPIAVYMEKSAYTLCAFLGIVYSGNYYCPLDTKSPKERCQKILDTLNPVAVIYRQKEQVQMFETGSIFFDSIFGMEASEKLDAGYHDILDVDPLYVLFTSGSTGQPKGVVISHKSVIDYTEWLSDTFHFNSDTIFGNQAPFFFDNSILDIYSTLKNGSAMVIIPEYLFSFPKRLLEYLKKNKINTIFWVPSALIHVANSTALSEVQLPLLKKVLFCGEVMPNKQLNIWRRQYPHLLYVNLYGPTEITDVCTYYIVDREFSDEEALPIGVPCRNTQILVLNEEGSLVTDLCEVGELCVRGTCISLGYYGDPEKTNIVFVQNPMNKNYRDIIYRTGDLVRYNEHGELIYLCRKDFQIKHQGHRIELGEIENATSAIDGVLHSCALYDDLNKVIVLFVNVDDDITEKTIYQSLKTKLPKYMVPGKINILDHFPMTNNGKIDRVTLRKEWF